MLEVKRIPDVSEHQGKIRWEKLKDKIPGAIIRVGYGDDLKSQDDLYAIYNMQECTRLGIPFAVYIYSYAATEKQIRSEIAHTKRVCAGFKPVSYWLDLEERGTTGIWKKAAQLWGEAFPEGGVYSWQWCFEKQLKGMDCGRWIAAYGPNSGKPESGYKPTIWTDGWQYTSRGILPGINGYVDMSEWYTDFGTAQAVTLKPTRRIVTKKEVAALIMRHLCTHKAHGYTQDMQGRQGTGEEKIDIYGRIYKVKSGDRDCSSAVISSYEAAGISCGGATYTGNMRERMVGTGNFIWRPMSFIAQMGDTYLNEDNHTAMCLSAEPDILMQFSINEKGKALGGKTGDQLQKGEYDETYGRGESHLKPYYDYPWDGILQCVDDAIAFIVEADGTISEPDGDDGYTGGGKKVAVREPEKTDTDLAVEVWDGVHGSGDKRRAALGNRYDQVQKSVGAIGQSVSTFVSANRDYLKKWGCDALLK